MKLSIEKKLRQCNICHIGFRLSDHTPDNNLCPDCTHWFKMWVRLNDPNVARIDGVHYMIGEENAKYKGMDGRGVKVIFFDGREVYTDNLWHQGKIPAVWKKLGLTDNARFIND